MKTSFPKEKIRVLLLEGVHPIAKDILTEEGFAVTSIDKALEGPALHKALAEGGGVHVVGIRSKTDLNAAALAASPRLLAAGCFCIGTNQVDLADAGKRGVAVFNSPFSNTRSVAELTIAETIALHRRMLDQSSLLHKGQWDKTAAGAHEVRGRVMGIVGYGHIGSQVSVLAEAMGMRVIFYDVISKLPMGNARSCRSLATSKGSRCGDAARAGDEPDRAHDQQGPDKADEEGQLRHQQRPRQRGGCAGSGRCEQERGPGRRRRGCVPV